MSRPGRTAARLLLLVAAVATGSGARADDPPFKFLFSYGQDDIVTCGAWSADGRSLATGTEVGTVTVTGLESRESRAIPAVLAVGNGVQSLRFSPDGRMLVAGGWGDRDEGGDVAVLRTGDWAVAARIDAHRGRTVRFVDVTADGEAVLSADHLHVVVSTIAGKVLRRLSDGTSGGPAAVADDGARWAYLAAAGNVGTVLPVDLESGKPGAPIPAAPGKPLVWLKYMKGKNELAILTGEAVLLRIDPASAAIRKTIDLGEAFRAASVECGDLGSSKWEFDLLDDPPLLVANDRVHTCFVNPETLQVHRFEHQSQVGIALHPTGRCFAVLGGIENPALTGGAKQEYWTVSLFALTRF